MLPEIVELADGAVGVRGLPLDLIRRRLAPRPAHRPPRPPVPLSELVAGVRELDEYQLPVTRTDLAAAVTDGDRKRLARDLGRHFPGIDDPWMELIRLARSEDGQKSATYAHMDARR